MSFTTNTALALKLPAWRSRVLIILLLSGFVILIGRALFLQGLNNDFLRQEGDARYSRVISLSANRGRIEDRSGEPLAISTPVESVAASPEDVEINGEQLKALSRIIDVPVSELQKRFSEKNREFVYLKRQLPPEVADQVTRLGIPGILLQPEYRRFYPAGDVMAHLIGFTDVDDNGQEGMELAYQKWLKGVPGSRRVIKDRLGHIVEDVQSIKVPQDGQDLVLSVDRNIQYLAYRELKAAVDLHHAKSGSIVVLDAKTGEVLALANSPSYNPNNRIHLTGNRARNRTVTDSYEPGSTLKPFTISAALDAGTIKPDTEFQTAPGSITIGKWTIHDAHPEGLLTVGQILQVSSNVGAAKIALEMPAKDMWEVLNHAGFGTVPHSGFPGEGAGKLHPYQTWQPIEQATVAYGNGISVTLLQLARAYTIFANDGMLLPISFLKLNAPVAGQQVITAQTARIVRKMLEAVVEPGGTAVQAQVLGYRVAGKTGTAHKLDPDGKYSKDRYVASFIGMAPASDPRLIIAVMVDEPSGAQYYGGQVAAPVFSNVMAGALRMLSVPHDAPVNQNVIPYDHLPVVKEMT